MQSRSPSPPKRDTSPPTWFQNHKEKAKEAFYKAKEANHGLHSAPIRGSEKRTDFTSAEVQLQEGLQSAPTERSEQIQGVHSVPIERSEKIIDFERCESEEGESSQNAQEVEAFIKANEHLLQGMAEEKPIQAGTEVLYQKSLAAAAVKVTLLKVHYEDDPPYYTIRMPDGREVQTLRGKLMLDSQEPAYPSADTTALKRVLGIVGAKVAALEAQIHANQVDNNKDNFYRNEMEKYDALLVEEGFTKAPVTEQSLPRMETQDEFQDLANTKTGSSISYEAQAVERSFRSIEAPVAEQSLPRVEEAQEEFQDLANAKTGSSVSCEAQAAEKSFPRVEEKYLPRVEEAPEEFQDLAHVKSGSSISCEAQAAEKSFPSLEEKSLPSVEEIPEELHELANTQSEANGKNRVDLVTARLLISSEAQATEESLPSVQESQEELHELEKAETEVNGRERVDLVMARSSSSCEAQATEESFANVETHDELQELERQASDVNARDLVDLVMASSSSSCEVQATEDSFANVETHDELHDLQKEKSDVNARDLEESVTTRSPSACEDQAAEKPYESMEVLDERMEIVGELHELENTKSEVHHSSSSNEQFAADDRCVKVGSFHGSIAETEDSLDNESTGISVCGSSFCAVER
jgi:hypothetical protein